ncbi:protein GLUTAMINE DUMPER 5-like [Rhodamnia argentea]|uniref:Protein GLUTAMINE DUMPER 5-like n=1 Tax=Rhodamnia argentea TaxID=178133 RepID=A0A8B8N5G7_9MYRT|nr:protein GLUTAMINE DUMPER 5-like [Rhodamnia argentea]
MRILVDTTYAVTPPSAATVSTPPAGPTASQRSPWHSPVPYLFGGLAAMLGLIGFALLILACSYWKLSGSSSNPRGDEENGGEAKTVDGEGCNKAVTVYEEKIVVIMAGDEQPTFLATPVGSRGPSFGDSLGKSNGDDGESFDAKKEEKDENFDKTKEPNNVNDDDVGGHVVPGLHSAAAEENRAAAEDQTQQQN